MVVSLTHLLYFPINQGFVTKCQGINKGINDSCLVENYAQFWQVFKGIAI
jgi:hypothetical protein